MGAIRKKPIVNIIIVMGILIFIVQAIYANTIEPGSKEDPVVTLSYVEQRIEQLKFYIDEKISPSQSSDPHSGGQNGMGIDIVSLGTGQSLIADEGTEIILRAGNAVAIDSPSGGLANVTAGRDIQKNQPISANHLHIVPKSDGRGVRALDNYVILMVRGSYRIDG